MLSAFLNQLLEINEEDAFEETLENEKKREKRLLDERRLNIINLFCDRDRDRFKGHAVISMDDVFRLMKGHIKLVDEFKSKNKKFDHHFLFTLFSTTQKMETTDAFLSKIKQSWDCYGYSDDLLKAFFLIVKTKDLDLLDRSDLIELSKLL
jgi:hypothetical protein